MNDQPNSRLVVVRAGYDDDAGVWYVQNSDMPGIHAEGSTLDELRDKLPAIVRDLIEASGEPIGNGALIEIIAHTSARVAA